MANDNGGRDRVFAFGGGVVIGVALCHFLANRREGPIPE